jgi:sugar-phosphatase
MTKAVIYDMDGIIINTLPLGKKVEYAIFKKHGVHLKEEMYKDTIGLREDETIAYWCKKYHWHNINQEEVLQEYLSYYEKEVYENGVLMRGVLESLQFFQNKQVKLAIASSSFTKQINAVVKKFDIEKYFDIIYSAEYEEYGKPHPGVYLTTAKYLHVSPNECLAIEDSLNGVIAAKAARMSCLYVPLEKLDNRAFCMADYALPSLSEINDGLWNKLNLQASAHYSLSQHTEPSAEIPSFSSSEINSLSDLIEFQRMRGQ